MPAAEMPDHPRFVALSAEHLAVLLLIAVVATALSVLLRRCAAADSERSVRRAVCGSLAAIMVGAALAGQLHRWIMGTWSFQESLPLHLCDLALLVSVAALLGIGGLRARPRYLLAEGRWSVVPPAARTWQRLYELAFVWGMGGTLQAVLTPDNAFAFPHFHFFRYFTTHSSIIIAALVLTCGLGMRLLPGTVRRVWTVTLLAALVVFAVNALLGANYMYLCGPPAQPSIIDLFGPWPYSLGTLVVVGTLLITLCYVPFWFVNRAARRRAVRRHAAAAGAGDRSRV